jgi:drug/metabolite transporter (DMT)-like permease
LSPPTSLPAPSPRVANAAIAVMCFVWGSTWIVIKGGLRDLPPQTSGAARFWLAGAAMAVLVRALRAREGGARPPVWLWVTLGTLNFGASYAIVYRTSTLLPSGLISLLWGVFPMLSALVSHVWIPGERLGPRQWWGFACGLAGLALLFATDLRSFGPGAIPAALVLLLSPLVSVLGNTLVKLHGAGVSSLELNRNAMFVGALWLTLAALLLEEPATARWTSAAVGSVLYLALMGTVLTFGLYFWLLRFVPAHKLSLIAYVTPAIALFFGVWLGGESITPGIVAGGAAILLGIVLVARGGHRAPRAVDHSVR